MAIAGILAVATLLAAEPAGARTQGRFDIAIGYVKAAMVNGRGALLNAESNEWGRAELTNLNQSPAQLEDARAAVKRYAAEGDLTQAGADAIDGHLS